MKQIKKVISQKEALRKYENITPLDNGMCEVLVFLKPNGKEDPASWNHAYRNSLKKTIAKHQKKIKPRKRGSKWYFGMSPWNPLRWLLWIIYLPFKIIWWLFKCIGLGFIGDWIGGDVGDMVSDGADLISDTFDVSVLFDGIEGFEDFEDFGDVIELFEDDHDDEGDADIAAFRKKFMGKKKKKKR